MSGRWSALRILLSAAAAMGAATGCMTDSSPGLVVVGNVVPEESCTIQAQGGGQQEFITRGELDVSVGTRYTLFLLVRNELETLSSVTGLEPESGRISPNTITLDGVEVELRFGPEVFQPPEYQPFRAALQELGAPQRPAYELTQDGNEVVLSYRSSAASSVEPDQSGALVVDVIPQAVGQLFRTHPAVAQGDRIGVRVSFRVTGRLQSDERIRSAEFNYPVQVCNNCLVRDVVPEGIARNPGAAPEDALPSDFEIPCTPGADNAVPNFFCGMQWAGEGCRLDRCLGQGGSEPDSLACPEDPQLLGEP